MSKDINWVGNHVPRTIKSEWFLRSNLVEHPCMKDPEAAERNRCAVFEYTNPAARLPNIRFYTLEELRSPDPILDLIGIRQELRNAALALFKAKTNIVQLDTHRQAGPTTEQMAAGLPSPSVQPS